MTQHTSLSRYVPKRNLNVVCSNICRQMFSHNIQRVETNVLQLINKSGISNKRVLFRQEKARSADSCYNKYIA